MATVSVHQPLWGGFPEHWVTGFTSRLVETGKPRKTRGPNGVKTGTPIHRRHVCTLSPDQFAAKDLNEEEAELAEKLLHRDYPNAVVNVHGSL